LLDELRPDSIHVSTEGPIGWAARRWCLANDRQFTSAFHTRFPDYVSMRMGIPAGWIWTVMHRFHGAAERTFTATPSLAAELREHGVSRTHHWPRGVDLAQFNPTVAPHAALIGMPRPIMLNVGRVSLEKNIEAFLALDLPGTKVVVGGGPALAQLSARYPDTLFLGPKHGEELAACYAAADVFVFPSRTDTFGLVNIEALACGVPVAAYPVAGPLDIVGKDNKGVYGGSEPIGALDEDLASAVANALRASRKAAAAEALHYSWEACTERFVSGLASDEMEPLESAPVGTLAKRA
jgi:glycosyltransferase involved in cell wall biosynthesis